MKSYDLILTKIKNLNIECYEILARNLGIKDESAFADWLVLHDQSMPGRNSDAILGNEKAGDGEDAVGARALPFDLDARVVHEYLGAYYLLR